MECSNRCSLEIKGRQPGSWQGTGCRAAAAWDEIVATVVCMAPVDSRADCPCHPVGRSQILREPGTGEWGHMPCRVLQPLMWQSCVVTVSHVAGDDGTMSMAGAGASCGICWSCAWHRVARLAELQHPEVNDGITQGGERRQAESCEL